MNSNPFDNEDEFPWPPGFSPSDFSQLFGSIQDEGPINWTVAKQTAQQVLQIAKQEDTSPSWADDVGDLFLAAEGYVSDLVGLSPAHGGVTLTSQTDWADAQLETLEPIFSFFATHLDETWRSNLNEAQMSELMAAILPVLLGSQAGALVGHLATHSLGSYDVVIPTTRSPIPSICAPNVERFESEWSLEHFDLIFYLALRETTHAALRSHDWVCAELFKRATAFVRAYDFNSSSMTDQLEQLMTGESSAIGITPHDFLTAFQTEDQERLLQPLHEFASILEAIEAHIVGQVAKDLIPSHGQLAEAIKRHLVERGEAERFVEDFLGVALTPKDYEAGETFCAGVIERGGLENLMRLFDSAENIPTTNEYRAPGLWLARLDLGD